MLSCARLGPDILRRGEWSPLLTFDSPDSAEALLELHVSADVNWADSNRTSALLRVRLDDRHSHDVLIPCPTFRSTTLLGPVSPGRHTVEVRLDPTYTASRVNRVRVQNARVRLVRPGDSLYAVIAHAPLLYGRPGNEHSDAPLVSWYERRSRKGQMSLLYSVIWSNEDGGTDTPDLLSRWGRTTDIEWIAEVFLDPSGRVDSVLFQGPDHETRRFQGRWRGGHPVLRTCTLNNNVCDHDTSDLLFALAPLRTRQPDQPREALMDVYSWTYRVMAGELLRERKLEPTPDPTTPAPGDLRDYLFVDFGTGGNWEDVDLIFSVRLSDGRWYHSNHGVDSVQCVNAPGWRRTSVELPQGFKLNDLRALRMRARGKGPFRVRVLGISQVFRLDSDWRPRTLPWSWSKPFELTPETPVREWDLSSLRLRPTAN